MLRAHTPQMPLVIEESFTAKLLEQLRDNEFDVATVALPIDSRGLSAWPLYDEEFMVLLPQDHRWAHDAEVLSKRLSEEHLLLLGPGHCFREQVIQACPQVRGVRRQRAACADWQLARNHPPHGRRRSSIGRINILFDQIAMYPVALSPGGPPFAVAANPHVAFFPAKMRAWTASSRPIPARGPKPVLPAPLVGSIRLVRALALSQS